MPVIGYPLASQPEPRADIAGRLGELGFDPALHYVDPETARRAPLTSVRMRLSILSRTYRREYLADAHDIERLTTRISAGAEGICFWGDQAAIGRLRGWIATGRTPRDDELDRLELGTTSFVDVGGDFGDGHTELCRAGSVAPLPGLGPALWFCGAWDCGAQLRAATTTFVCITRTRPSGPGVRGGTAVHRLFTRQLRSTYWGAAPWYVTDRGHLELSDYRELYRDPAAVAGAIADSPELLCASAAEARYIETMLRFNLGHDGARTPPVVVADGAAEAVTRWQLRASASAGVLAHNRVVIAPSADGPFASLEDALDASEAHVAACVIVRLPLTDPEFLGCQLELRELGFRFTALRPPSATGAAAPTATGGGVQTATHAPAFEGMWSRPRPDLYVGEPYYFGSRLASGLERSLIAYVSACREDWTQRTRATAGRARVPSA